MERLMEDALNINSVLPWIETPGDILLFLRSVPLDNSHLRIPLALSHFINIRDQIEGNSEENIENDAREIVVLLPDTPYNLIKTRLRELGNVYNRKEVVIRHLINSRPELKQILAELNKDKTSESLGEVLELNNVRKRTNLDVNELYSDIDTTFQIKIRKIEGGVDPLSSSTSPEIRTDKMDETPCTSTVTNADCTLNVMQNLREITQATEETIRKTCADMNIPLNQIPNATILNRLLNKIYDESVIEVYDNDSDTTEVNSLLSDTDSLSDFPKDYSTKDNDRRLLIKPATLVLDNNRKAAPSTSTDTNVPYVFHYNRMTVPAMPQAYLDRIAESNKEVTPTSNEDILEESPVQLLDSRGSSTISEESAVSATTYQMQQMAKCDEKLVLRLIEIFPESCPQYIRKICRGKKWKHLDDLVTVILSEDHPRRPQRVPSPPKEVDIDEQLEIVKALLPDADPTFLRWKCETIGNNMEELNTFINEAREKKDYPTMKEYLRKQKFTAQYKQYTTEFKVENFVELFPDPEKTFRDPKRTVIVDNYSSLYICNFFQIRYDRLALKTIRFILTSLNYRILRADDEMKRQNETGPLLKTKRKQNCLKDPPQNITVLQELAYLTHKEDIENFIKEKQRIEEEERKIAKETGLIEACDCCYYDEVMPKNSFSCPAGCTFCRDCIQKSCEVALGDGKTEFKCLNNCPEEFSLQVLQKVLPPKMFSKLAQKKTLAEVKAAGIEELECCPFCDFASIPVENDKIFRCLNPDCMKESCRLCKEENHVPYKCDELEKDEDVKARVFVENQMTEALLCKCYKCGTSFFKEEGCNKMTCTCGAHMCYICKKPVKNYEHFNGIGGDKFHLCPLYSDTNEINEKNVSQAAEQAKSKVDPTKLKVDPTLDVKEHYENRKKQLPVEPYLQLINQQVDPTLDVKEYYEKRKKQLPAEPYLEYVNQERNINEAHRARLQLHYLQDQNGRRHHHHFHYHHHP